MRSASFGRIGAAALVSLVSLGAFAGEPPKASAQKKPLAANAAPSRSRMFGGAASTENAAAPADAALIFGAAQIEEKSQARELYQRAVRALLDQKPILAEDLLGKAFELDRTYDLAANLGDLELKNQKPELAAKHLLFAIRHLPSGLPSETSERLRKRFADAQRMAGAYRIQVQPASAAVHVDGARVLGEDLAAGVFVSPGTHTIRVTNEGFEPYEQSVTAPAGEVRDLSIELSKKPIRISLPPATPEQESQKSQKPARPPFVSGLGHLALYTSLAASAVAFGYAEHTRRENNAMFRKLTEESDRLQTMQGPDACWPGEEPHFESACKDLERRSVEIKEHAVRYQIAYAASGISFGIFLAYGAYMLWGDTKTTVLPTVTRNAGALVLTRVW